MTRNICWGLGHGTRERAVFSEKRVLTLSGRSQPFSGQVRAREMVFGDKRRCKTIIIFLNLFRDDHLQEPEALGRSRGTVW